MIEEYKNISIEIMDILKSENVNEYELEARFIKRQEILDKSTEEELEDFRKNYRKSGIYEIDEEIKNKLQKVIGDVKKELSEYREKKAVNFAYANINKTNLNIFSKKV